MKKYKIRVWSVGSIRSFANRREGQQEVEAESAQVAIFEYVKDLPNPYDECQAVEAVCGDERQVAKMVTDIFGAKFWTWEK